jgi:hypothetical protein
MSSDDDRLLAYWTRMCALVTTHGWAVQTVFADPVASTPHVAYTIGLCAKGLPELLLVGVNSADATQLLNDAARKSLEGLIKGDKGEILDRWVNLPAAPRRIVAEHAADIAVGAVRYALEQSAPFSMIQMVLPDRAGLFPWDPGCDPGMRTMQAFWTQESPWQDEECPPGDHDASTAPRPSTLH